jgi:hypothetical protein
MGLRQMLPVQTKRTLFTICAARERAHLQPRIEQSQVNREPVKQPTTMLVAKHWP